MEGFTGRCAHESGGGADGESSSRSQASHGAESKRSSGNRFTSMDSGADPRRFGGRTRFAEGVASNGGEASRGRVAWVHAFTERSARDLGTPLFGICGDAGPGSWKVGGCCQEGGCDAVGIWGFGGEYAETQPGNHQKDSEVWRSFEELDGCGL